MLRTLEKPNKGKDLKLQAEVVLVTPEIARAWLDKNKKNRKHSASVVGAYARDMKAGRWPLTGDAIRFDKAGSLIDGQHRLMACIEAQAPFPSLVIYGLASDIQLQIDVGKARRANDVLTLLGFHYTNRLAAAARVLAMIKKGGTRPHSEKFTHSEIVAVVKKHPPLAASSALVETAIGAPGSLLAATHYIGAHLLGKSARANAFIEVWKTGIPNYDGDPAQKLRERLLRTASSKQEFRRGEVVRLVVHSWNAFAKRRSIDIIRSPKAVEFEGLDTKLL